MPSIKQRKEDYIKLREKIEKINPSSGNRIFFCRELNITNMKKEYPELYLFAPEGWFKFAPWFINIYVDDTSGKYEKAVKLLILDFCILMCK